MSRPERFCSEHRKMVINVTIGSKPSVLMMVSGVGATKVKTL